MWKVVLVALALTAWCCAAGEADARPKFVGNCLSDDGVKKLFQTYTDVAQVGPWKSDEIAGRKRTVFIPGTGFIPDAPPSTEAGKTHTVIDRPKKGIALTGIPEGMTVVATLCGSLSRGGGGDEWRADHIITEALRYRRARQGAYGGS